MICLRQKLANLNLLTYHNKTCIKKQYGKNVQNNEMLPRLLSATAIPFNDILKKKKIL